MRKLLALAGMLFVASSCSSTQALQNFSEKIRNFGEPRPATMGQENLKVAEKYSELRKYVARYTDKLISVSSDKTLILGRNLDSGVDAIWNVIPHLYTFCKAHGGNLVAGEGLDSVSYEAVNGKPEAMKYFGPNTSFRCEGGSYPFEVKHLLGRAGNSSSVMGWIAETILYIKHKPEPAINTRFAFSKEEMNKLSQMSYPEFLAFVRSKPGMVRRPTKLGGNKIKAEFIVRNPVPSYVIRSMSDRMGFVWYAAEYCKAQGGNLYKDGKPFESWFTDFAVGKPRLWGWPYTSNHKRFYPLAGMYACIGGNQSFELGVKPYGYYNNYFGYEYIVKPGTEFYLKKYPQVSKVENTDQHVERKFQQKQQVSQPNSGQTQIPVQVSGIVTQIIAAKAAYMKSDFEKQQGEVKAKAFYNGVDNNGCDLVSVFLDNAGEKTVYNYRVCGGKLSRPVVSDLTGIPKQVKKAELEVAKKARDYGTYSAEVNGYRLIGKALRDESRCLVEVRVLEDGFKLVGVNKIDACRN